MKPETLKKNAEKATQTSPWSVQRQGERYVVLDADGFWVADVGEAPDDARHIATSHPQAVINLVEENERLCAQIKSARAAARVYATRVNELGAAADDNDPAVMATAGPIGAAQADLWTALGIYECDYRYEHDTVNDRPAGKQCSQDATHVITWQDGRFSFGCADHLEIERAATVKPVSIAPLSALRTVFKGATR